MARSTQEIIPMKDQGDTLEHAATDDLPSDILAMAFTALLGDPIMWRDI